MSKHLIGNIPNRIVRVDEFITVDIWRIRLEDLSFGKSFLIKQLRIIILTLRGFNRDNCFLRASSLTFFTLLSIVPVLAMLFGIAKGFGFEKMLEGELRQLIGKFPGQEEVLSQAIQYAEKMLETTKGGVIGGIGLVMLFWAVIKVLNNIEASLNDIWKVNSSRSWGRKFSDYLSVMLISPLIILVSGSATVFITTTITKWTSQISLLGIISPLISLGFSLIPYVLMGLLFTVIYILMPNTRVNFTSGLVAGIVAGTIYQIVQWAYILFQIGAARYGAIYGSFAALPLFLLWVQTSWWIVLLGAEISYAHQNVDTYQYEPDLKQISPAYKKLLTLQVAHLLVKNFANCGSPLNQKQISAHLQIPIRLLDRILSDLVACGLFIETRTPRDKAPGIQPACAIDKLTIQRILETLEHHGKDSLPVAQTAELAVLSDSLKKFSEALENSPANRLLKEI